MKQCHYALCALFATCLPLTAHAESPTDEQASVESDQPWSFSASSSYSRNAYRDTSYLASRSIDASVTLGYRFDDNWSLSADIAGIHQFDGEKGQYWQNAWIKAKYADLYQPTENLSFSAGMRVLIPLSETAQKSDLSTAIRADLSLSYDMAFLLEGLTLTDSVRIRKNFHRYTTVGTTQLEEYRLSNSFGLTYEFGDWWLSATIDSSTSWTYRGNEYSPEFSHSEELGYNVTENISLAVGLTNSARYFDADRGPNPIDTLFDLDKPTYYLSITYNY